MTKYNRISCSELIEILLPILPEDIIRAIASYIIMKIPKNDQRYPILNYLYFARLCTREQLLFWKNDGTFRGFFVTFTNANFVFVMTVIKDFFISYQFQNMTTKEYSVDRCWFHLNDKFAGNTNYHWEHVIDRKWVQNPNSPIISINSNNN